MILKNENMGFWCHTLLQNITTDLRYKPQGKILDKRKKVLLIVRYLKFDKSLLLHHCLIHKKVNITYCYSTECPLKSYLI